MQINQNGHGGPVRARKRVLTLAQRFRLAEYLKANAARFGRVGRDAIADHATRELGFSVSKPNINTIIRECEIPIAKMPGGGSRFICSAKTMRTILDSIASLRAEIGAEPDLDLNAIRDGMPADD